MPFQYTGYQGNVQAPDPGPAPGRNPTILLPDDFDLNNTGTWGQPFKCLADYVAYFTAQLNPNAPLGPPFFGDGSDGPLTVSGLTTITGQTKNFTDLTIGSGGVLQSIRSIIRVNGTLTIDAAGLIHDNGANGTTGFSTAPSFGGQGSDGIGGSVTALCPVGGGTSGGNGGAGGDQNIPIPGQPGGSGADFSVSANTLGIQRNAERAYVGYSAKGGAGGHGTDATAGNGGAAGVAGCGGATADDVISDDLLAQTPLNVLAAGFVRRTRYVDHGSGDKGSISELVPLRGGAGGGGGGGEGQVFGAPGGTPSSGGSGGAGGGVIMIFAKNVYLGSSSCIQARGGSGSPGAYGSARYYFGTNDSGGGGSGGGGGGRVILMHGGLVVGSSSLVAANTVGGGLKGSPTGTFGTSVTDGTNGDQGTLYVRKVW